MRAAVMWIGSQLITIANVSICRNDIRRVFLRALLTALRLAQQLHQNGCIKLRGVLQAQCVASAFITNFLIPVFFVVTRRRDPQIRKCRSACRATAPGFRRQCAGAVSRH